MTPYVSEHFGFGLEILFNPFSISTIVGKSITAKKVYKVCVVSIIRTDTLVDLIKIYIVNLDVILTMD